MFEGLLLPWQQIYHFAILEQFLKFLANFTLFKYVKSQRSYGFLITKKADFWLPNFGLKSSLLSLLNCTMHTSSSKNKRLPLYPCHLIFCSIVSAFLCLYLACLTRQAFVFRIAGVHVFGYFAGRRGAGCEMVSLILELQKGQLGLCFALVVTIH